jgi:hypothetical protein
MGARSISLASSILALSTLAACGGSSGGRSTTPTGGDASGGSGGASDGPVEVTAAAVCGRIFELKASGCDLVGGYELSRDECLADYTRSLEERGVEARLATQTAGRCLLDHPTCGEITACFDEMSSGANNGAPEEYRACSQTDVYAPVGLAKADWDRRKGTGITRFSQAASTKEDPVAVCGIPSEMTWLLAMQCDDGSNPYESYDHAHASRVGNVGPGGKCGSIIDLYEVPCPEGTYAIYIDAYVCAVPAGQPVP